MNYDENNTASATDRLTSARLFAVLGGRHASPGGLFEASEGMWRRGIEVLLQINDLGSWATHPDPSRALDELSAQLQKRHQILFRLCPGPVGAGASDACVTAASIPHHVREAIVHLPEWFHINFPSGLGFALVRDAFCPRVLGEIARSAAVSEPSAMEPTKDWPDLVMGEEIAPSLALVDTEERKIDTRLGDLKTITEVTGKEAGVWEVLAQRTTYRVDLDAGTLTRVPGVGSSPSINDGTRPLRKLNCRVGRGAMFILDPAGAGDPTEFYWQSTTIIRSIVRLDLPAGSDRSTQA